MVGTGANRQPLTKIHPILLGKQKGGGGGGGGGSSLLAKHRQQHQANQERRSSNHNQQQPQQQQQQQQQPQFGSPNQMHGPPPGFGQKYPSPDMQSQYPPQNSFPRPMMQQQQQYNQTVSQGPYPPANFNQQQAPPPPQYMPPPQQQNNPPLPPGPDAGVKKKRKRPSRWGDKEEKPFISGPLTLPAHLTEDQRTHYLLQFKIEEISVKLRTGELGIPADPAARSPSPEPIYNSEGKRLNTREYRVRKRLEEERHDLIKQAAEEVPNYKPPVDYKPPTQKISDKVFIPSERNPAVNFIGLLIGPRGNTLKRLEKETGCKIIIRGKGSVKEGKVGRIPGQLMPGEDEPLHALITGPTEKDVKVGVKVVTDIVKEGIECPDAANELRRNQLRELAELNGTLIDEEIIKCKNCGASDHRHWECQEQKNITSQITCHKCGGYGHVAVDCRSEMESGGTPIATFAEKAKMDTEYMSLMAELGVEGPPPPKRTFSEKATPKPPPPRTDRPEQGKPPPPSSSRGDRGSGSDRGSNNDRGSGSSGNRRRESKWGPPASGSSQPKSLMDINVGPETNFGSTNQFPAQTPPPNQNQSGPPPWMNQQRPPAPNAPPPANNAVPPPWQQGPPPPRGPPGYGAPPPQHPGGAYPSPNQPPPEWQQPTTYPQQWQQQQPYGYNPYQQMQQMPNQAYAAPPPPWSQPPPPPPPPPPSS